MRRTPILIIFLVFFASISAYASNSKSIDEVLLKAAQDGNVQFMRELIASGADVNAKNNIGATALMLAAQKGHADIVKELLDKGANVNAKANHGETALMNAAYNGNADVVKRLIANGADVNAKNDDGVTALIVGAQEGHTDIVQLLKNAGASSSGASDTSVSANIDSGAALLDAAENGDANLVKQLIAEGADVNTKSKKNGATALMYAALYGDADLVKQLLAKGADVNVRSSKTGATALMGAAQKGNTNVIKQLLVKGADVNAKANTGETALMYAAYNGDTDLVSQLIANGADVNAKNNNGATALTIAAQEGRTEIVQLLKNGGVNSSGSSLSKINSENNGSGAALLDAAKNGNANLVKQVIADGADVNTKNNIGFTALMLAAQKGHADAVEALLANRADVNAKSDHGETALEMAAYSGNEEIVRQLLANGADIKNAANNDGVTPSEVAEQMGHKKLAQWLRNIERSSGASNSNVTVKDDNSPRTLLTAAYDGNVELVRQLLANGVDVNTKAENGVTPLMYAALKGHADVAKELLDKGANVNVKSNKSGATALMAAAQSGSEDVVKLLIANGADVNAKDNDGYTASMYADSNGHMEIAQLLKNAEKLPVANIPMSKASNEGYDKNEAKAVPAKDARIIRLKKYSCIDKQTGIEAFSLLMPVDWEFQGGIDWVLDPGLPALPHFKVSNPKGTEAYELFPPLDMVWSDNPMFASGCPVGSRCNGAEARPVIADPVQALTELVLPRFRGKVEGLKIVSQKSLPEVAKADLATESGLPPGFRPFENAAQIRIEYMNGNIPMEELAKSKVHGTSGMTGTGTQYIWQVGCVSYRAKKGDLDANAYLFGLMEGSIQFNPEWTKITHQVSDHITQIGLSQIRTIGECSRIWSKTANEIREINSRSYWDNQKVKEQTAKNYDEYIRGTETYNNPSGGGKVELPGGYNYPWTNASGEYLLTDSPSYNPNIGSNIGWLPMTK